MDALSMAREPATQQTKFVDVGFRYSNYDTPFWVRPNSDEGRWHRIGDDPTQYLSTTVEGAWAELIRAEGLRSEAEVALLRMPMWAADLDVHRIADYGSFEKAGEAGFAPDALIDEDYSRCQREGRRLREAGYLGVLAPSAALPGSVNLTLFGPRIASRWGMPSALASSIPATKIAVGSPPEEIVGQVRQRGEPDPSYEAYLAARRQASRKRSEE
ncbi:MAG: RES family NAD+ phosphorylase [Solirubrobacterales bacterium]